MPFALRLVSQCAGLAAEAVVEQVDSVERLTPRGGVDAQRPRNAFAKLARLGTVVLQRQHCPVPARLVGQPGRVSTPPEGQDFAADVIAAEGVEAGGGSRQPIGLDPRVIVC